MKRALLASIVLWLPLGRAGAEEACLRYEPAIVELSGRVILRTFPGPPNYESIPKGDRAETQALLELDRPICVLADPKDELSADEHDQRLVTLVPASGMKLAEHVRTRVHVEGTLFHAHTGHHRTPVLVQVRRIRVIGRPGAVGDGTKQLR